MFMEKSLIVENKNQSEYKQCGILKVVQNIKNINMCFSHDSVVVKLNITSILLTFSNNIIVSSKEIFSNDFKKTIQENEIYHEKLEKLLELQLS